MELAAWIVGWVGFGLLLLIIMGGASASIVNGQGLDDWQQDYIDGHGSES